MWKFLDLLEFSILLFFSTHFLLNTYKNDPMELERHHCFNWDYANADWAKPTDKKQVSFSRMFPFCHLKLPGRICDANLLYANRSMRCSYPLKLSRKNFQSNVKITDPVKSTEITFLDSKSRKNVYWTLFLLTNWREEAF